LNDTCHRLIEVPDSDSEGCAATGAAEDRTEVAIVVEKGLITLLPDRPLASLKGFLKDMKTGEIREKRDRF
jgi:hypothetical protein